jgi:hypothetical protein
MRHSPLQQFVDLDPRDFSFSMWYTSYCCVHKSHCMYAPSYIISVLVWSSISTILILSSFFSGSGIVRWTYLVISHIMHGHHGKYYPHNIWTLSAYVYVLVDSFVMSTKNTYADWLIISLCSVAGLLCAFIVVADPIIRSKPHRRASTRPSTQESLNARRASTPEQPQEERSDEKSTRRRLSTHIHITNTIS